MGCDIHAHVEIKVDGEWLYYSQPNVKRNYTLFSAMAGVRKESAFGVPQVAEPRGIPDDITRVTKMDLEYWGNDGHSHSWLTGAEAERAAENTRRALDCEYYTPFGYVFGNGLGYNGAAARMGVSDIRVVFWFDN